ncbi:hypothetical protein JOM56_009443 [Amanita muscaria]
MALATAVIWRTQTRSHSLAELGDTVALLCSGFGFWQCSEPPPLSVPRFPSVPSSTSSELSRNPFGFRQLIIAATDFGKVYTINGEIVWSQID